ncbi:HK97 family phage prohead protease [Pseudonocardia alni]|uniref:Phage head maturation protease n=1 Tax=Pseudonocardia alni TaxID=33907 RepID=A0A852W0F7_PSEA5|nr:HK97 family phage prohead protease [Pseudonocardia antarctica]NYG00354.1 phage head maturation protease [Pseudonocardia antarctica]
MPRYERKAAAAPAAPETGETTDTGVLRVDPARATVTAIAAVTGTVDLVSDRIVPGAFTKTLAARTPKVCRGHDWNVPIGRVVSIKELRPGDPDLPRRTGSGRPWPPEAGALIVQVRFNTAKPEGKAALADAQFYGSDSEWSIGYKAVRARQVGGVRELHEVDLFEVSTVLVGAHPDARTVSVKAASAAGVTLETKGATTALPRAAGPYRTRLTCGLCGGPAGAMHGDLGRAMEIICAGCVDALDELIADRAVLTADDLAAADDVEPEAATLDAYAQALDDEQTYDLLPDGDLLMSGEDDEQTGPAWRPGRTSSY